MNINTIKQLQMAKSLKFLNDHPCLSKGDHLGFLQNHEIFINAVSKYGYCELDPIYVYRDSKDYLKFKNRFKKSVEYVLVNHKDYFGEPWSEDHVEYWCALSSFIYIGDFNEKPDETQKLWERYAGDDIRANTFEDLIIKCEEVVRKNYGGFTADDFLTANEIKNHKKYRPFNFIKSEGGFNMDRNPKYIKITPAMINRRWVNYYINHKEDNRLWINDLKKLIKKTPKHIWGK